MGFMVANVKIHKSGRAEYRRAFPPKLLPFIPGKEGQRWAEFKKTLGLPGTSGFHDRLAAAIAEYEQTVAVARQRQAGAYDPLDAPRIAYLGKVFEAQWLQGEDAIRKEGGREGWADRVSGGWEWHLDDFRRWYAEANTDEAEEFWEPPARKLLAAQPLVVDPSDELGFTHLCMELNEAAIRVSEVSLARLSGRLVASPQVPEEFAGAAKPVRTAVPLLATYDAYTAAQGVSAGVRKEWRAYIQHLVDFVGHDDAARLTRDDVVHWRDHLLVTPNRLGNLRKAVTVRDKYVTALKCTLGWALGERKLRENVAADVRVTVPKRTMNRETPDFTMDEAKAILRASLEPPKGRLSAPNVLARRWIPWLCAYSGARVNEISQLRKEDIRQVESIWIIDIKPEAGSVKTGVARQVPLHAHVIEQGFLDVVGCEQGGALFYDPSGRRSGDEGNRHVKKVGERLAKWVRKDVGITDPELQPNHAWRHLFKTLASEAGIEERVADALQGHATANASRGYGSSTMKTKAAAMGKFPRFELT